MTVGELQRPMLAVAAASWNEDGEPVVGELGELVITEPMPSMPLRFWNDPDDARYREAYFEPWPGVWRHGDWLEITDRGTCIITGRSDSTLNRGGVRMGTADIYAAVESIPAVLDCVVLGVEQPDGGYWMPLFVQLAPGEELTDELSGRAQGGDPVAGLAPGTCPTRSSPSQGCRTPAPASAWRCRSSGCSRASTRPRRSTPARSTTPRSSSTTSRWRRSAAADRRRLASLVLRPRAQGGTVLADSYANPVLPAKDGDRARAFYRDVLGLTLVTGPADDPIVFSAGSGTTLLVTEMPDREPAGYATVSFLVTGIEGLVADLAAKGVEFVPPDSSSFQGVEGTVANGVIDYGPVKSVWLRDSEGNLLALNEIVDASGRE